MNTFGRGMAASLILLLLLVGQGAVPSPGSAAEPEIQGEYELLSEPSQHEKGKVILFEFADFYCPHCHMFETIVIPKLKAAFGDRLETRMVGFPVMPGKLPTAFEMYEQAVTMGKGHEMKQKLFDSIHRKKIEVFDKTIRRLVLTDLGLDIEAFEQGLASGQPYRTHEKGREWGERIQVTHTPTVVIDGNLRVPNLNEENLKVIIQSILDRDAQS